MDEPFGALDYQTRLLMQRLLLDLWQEFRPTIFFITHDVGEAIFISDRVIAMTPPQHVLAMRQLFDAVAFVGIEHQAGLDADGFQRAMKHDAHRDRAAAVVHRVQDERRRADLGRVR